MSPQQFRCTVKLISLIKIAITRKHKAILVTRSRRTYADRFQLNPYSMSDLNCFSFRQIFGAFSYLA